MNTRKIADETSQLSNVMEILRKADLVGLKSPDPTEYDYEASEFVNRRNPDMDLAQATQVLITIFRDSFEETIDVGPLGQYEKVARQLIALP